MRPFFCDFQTLLFTITSVFEFLKNWNHQKMSFPEMHRSLFFLFVQIAFSKFRIPDETLHHAICPRKKKRFFSSVVEQFQLVFDGFVKKWSLFARLAMRGGTKVKGGYEGGRYIMVSIRK